MKSSRVNGKLRPIFLEYLGTAEALPKRLREGIPKKVRFRSHGAVAVMLDIAEELQIVQTIRVLRKRLEDMFHKLAKQKESKIG